MKQVVYWLQCDANQTFEREGHVKVNTTPDGKIRVATCVTRPPPRHATLRMLSDTVHDSKLRYRIHALFVWLLRVAHSAIHEVMFEALPTEEQTTLEERKRTSSPPRDRAAQLTTSTTQSDISDEDDYDSLQYQYSSYGQIPLQLFKEFIARLGNVLHLRYILYHWVIGNQLIVQYINRIDDKDFIRAFASVLRVREPSGSDHACFFSRLQLFIPAGCCHLIETTELSESCPANLILLETDLLTSIDTSNSKTNTIVIKIILDDHLQLATLETLPPANSDILGGFLKMSSSFETLRSSILVPTYVDVIVDILMDHRLDAQAFEAMIIQQKMKYLKSGNIVACVLSQVARSIFLAKPNSTSKLADVEWRPRWP